jgi:transposase InsO family protein
LLGLIKHSWLESGGVYGYRKIYDDLSEVSDDGGGHRVARLMRLEGLRSPYSSSDWRSFLKANNLVASMSRRGNW